MASDFLPAGPFMSLIEISRNFLFMWVFRLYAVQRTVNRVQIFRTWEGQPGEHPASLPNRESDGVAADELNPRSGARPVRRQDSGRHMKPWLKMIQRRIVVKGRQGAKVTVTVRVYRDTVWITTFDEPFSTEAILELAHVGSLVEMLTWAVGEARSYQQDGDAG